MSLLRAFNQQIEEKFNVVNGMVNRCYRNEQLFDGNVNRQGVYTKSDLQKMSNDMSPAGKLLFKLMENNIPEEIKVQYSDKKGYNNSTGRRVFGSFYVNKGIPTVTLFEHKPGMNKALIHELLHSALDGYRLYQIFKDSG